VSKNGHISSPLVPNQALYQAEPQPELIVNPARQRGARPYFACFATCGKQFTLRRIVEGYLRITTQRSSLARSSQADRIGRCFRRPILA
jgi:hypothetical protein